MEEIKVGEYVRTISGNIDKVDALYGMIENTIHLENHKWQSTKNIVKHNKNIIDLIEVGDYVNGDKVVDKDNNSILTLTDSGQTCYRSIFESKDIKSIITKEQIKQIEYRIGD